MHPDVPQEQAYFDHAADLRDRLEANLDRAASLAADPKTAADLRRRVGALGVVDPGQAVAFGRIDVDGKRWYIGRGAIWDENDDLLVVNWQAPIAAPFYIATRDSPEGLDARRIFRCKENRIVDIDELVFNGVASAVDEGELPEPVITDGLLEALGRERSGALAEIVTTIQSAQYDVVARDAEQLLIVQGGPGTGKTVVGLHRVSWLLFNRGEELRANDVLVVGPNPAFLRYVSAVLPALGEGAVVQLPLASLGPRVPIDRVDPLNVRRLKGDRRMLRLLVRAVRNRQRVRRGSVEFTVEGRKVEIGGDRLLGRARQVAGHPHNEARRALRAFLIGEAREQLQQRALRDPSAAKITLQGDAVREIDSLLDRVWPNLTPQAFLSELLSTRQQLDAAAVGLLTDEEIELLMQPRDSGLSARTWSVDDVALLDLADALLNGGGPTYEHIVVDEAQDLSPMQFESVRRRSRTGWMTVLGDLAQATSPWAPSSWEEVALHLRRDRVPTEIAELTLGYRLPCEVHDVAMRLLPEIAPGLRSPESLRSSGHPVTVVTTSSEELGDEVARAVRSMPGTGLIGVIAAADDRPAVTEALDEVGLSWSPELDAAASPITVVGIEGTKGLEFDHVVVVEPGHLVDESPQGLRALFVALTRPTSRLAVVHAKPLPAVLSHGGLPDEPEVTRELEALDLFDEVDEVDDHREADDVGAEYLFGEAGERDELDGGVMRVDFDEPDEADGRYVPDELGEPEADQPDPEPGPDAIAPAVSPPAPAGVEARTPGERTNGNIDLRAESPAPDPLLALDREMARAIAAKLAEALTRYAAPTLIPLVVEEMTDILQAKREH
ncbi:MAG: HelD family protein [Acidimicrobiales bacterium]